MAPRVACVAMHTTTYIDFFAQYAGSAQGRNGDDRGDHLNHPLPQSADLPFVVTSLFANIAVAVAVAVAAVVVVVVFVVVFVVALVDIVECDESDTSKALAGLLK